MSQLHKTKDPAGPECNHEQHAIHLDNGIFKEIAISWLPTGPRAILFVVIMLVCLVVSIIHFALSGDTSMLTQLLICASAYAGLPEVKASLTGTQTLLSPKKGISDTQA